jgi:hypothetical protein
MTETELICLLDAACRRPLRDAAAEKNRQGSELSIRDDLAADLRVWLADKLAKLQADAKKKGMPIPAKLPAETRLFNIPAGLLRIRVGVGLHRQANVGVPHGRLRRPWRNRAFARQRVERRAQGMNVERSASFVSFGNAGGFQVTVKKLLDVREALGVLPALSLDRAKSSAAPLAPRLAPTHGNSVTELSIPVTMAGEKGDAGEGRRIAATSIPVKANTPLPTCDSGVSMSGRPDTN